MPLPPPSDEDDRLAALVRLAVLDTPPEAAFDDLTRLAAALCGTPIALVSLIDADRQWFKSRHGLDATETPRAWAFCDHAIRHPHLFEVPDAAADARFAANPLVTSDPRIRFYAGVPLATPDGFAVGTLCVIDRTPRTLTPDQRDALTVLARQVVAQLLLRRRVADLTRTEAALRESEERFRAAMEGSLNAVFFLAAERDEAGRITDFRFTDVNHRGARLVTRDPEDVLGRRLCELLPVNRTDGFFDKYVRVMETGETLEEEFPIAAAGITAGWLHHQVVRAGDGVAITSQDVTERKRAEDALLASEAKFRGTLDRLAEGVYLIDAGTGRFADVNAALLATLGYTRGEFLRLALPDLVAGEPPEVIARTAAASRAALAAGGRCDLGRRRFRRKDGSEVRVDVKVTAVPDGGAGLHAVIVRDISEQVAHEEQLLEYQRELERANARLKTLAHTDGLTGVKNRAAFNDKLAEEFDRAVRHDHPLSVVLLDVDHFKPFNDAFGHPAGDDVLKQVAALLQQTVRGTDAVARYGGEEFAIVLPDTDRAGAMVLAERCRRAIAGGGWDRRAITISVGVATLTPTTADAPALVQEADDALYRSKHAGRNRVSHGTQSIPHPAARTAAGGVR